MRRRGRTSASFFGDAGYAAHCQCQRYKLGQAGYAPYPREARAEALRGDTLCGQPDAVETSGLVAYVGGEPTGWVAVEPRVNYPRLGSATSTAWKGRGQDRSDPSVWSVTCFRVRNEFQGEGLTYPLAAGFDVVHEPSKRRRVVRIEF